MTVLGISTASQGCGAALAADGRIIASASAGAPMAHAERLLAVIDECLRAGAAAGRPAAVAVASGPGSFTGLRIGFSTAKGLCLAYGCALVAVPTFDAWAFAAARNGSLAEVPAGGGAFIAAMSAGREDAYVAVFRRDGASTRAEAGPEVRAVADLPAIAAGYPGAPVLSDRPELAASWFGGNDGDAGRSIVSAVPGNPADAVALLGAELFAAGVSADLGASEPAYLKDFSSTRKH
jgi:tRNA threonylcarbamoyladenosine biosynthesis protein TsaB